MKAKIETKKYVILFKTNPVVRGSEIKQKKKLKRRHYWLLLTRSIYR